MRPKICGSLKILRILNFACKSESAAKSQWARLSQLVAVQKKYDQYYWRVLCFQMLRLKSKRQVSGESPAGKDMISIETALAEAERGAERAHMDGK